MHVSVNPYKIEKLPQNQVTSSNPFKKNQRKVSDSYEYDPDGIFSERIFGRFKKCACGELNEPGFCKICNTRVVDQNNMPDFFIDLGIMIPKLYVEYGKFKDVKKVLTYEAFVYDNNGTYEIVEADINTPMSDYEYGDIYIGIEAAKLIHPDIDSWINDNMIDYINVPHPVFRPNLRYDDGAILISPINKNLIDILSNLENLNGYREIFNESQDEYEEELKKDFILYCMSFSNEIYNYYENFEKSIFKLLADGKESYVGNEMRCHRITGAVKGTIVNRYDVDEDVVLIGDTFIQTLYPNLYKECEGNMEKINDYFVEKEARVILNRPPTIGHLSIMGMKPRVASCYKFGTFKDGALGKNKQSPYDEEIDTIGIRTIGINPIVTDGFAGDYDGDTMLLIALYSKKACQEADSMLPSKNFMNYSNGEVRNKIPEDIEYIRNVK